MAGLSIAVCLPPEAAGHVDEEIAAAMAPFYADYSRSIDLDIWDFMRISGHMFALMPGADADHRLIESRPNFLGDVEPLIDQWGGCTGGPRALLDFSATAERAREIADATWVRWHELAAEFPEADSWDVCHQRMVDRRISEREFTLEQMQAALVQAKAAYDTQPLIAAFLAYRDSLAEGRTLRGYAGWFMNHMDPHHSIGPVARDAFVDSAMYRPLREYSVLTADGWWCEAGELGVHGSCNGPAECQHEPPIPADPQAGYDYLAALPGDTLLVGVHCHV